MESNKTITIMLIEDSDLDNFVHERLFKAYGHHFRLLIYTEALSALDYFKHLKPFTYQESSLVPEYIFLDLLIPVVDGFDFLKAFKALPNPFNSKIVILTASISTEDRIRAEKFKEVHHYFIKPLLLKYLETLNWEE